MKNKILIIIILSLFLVGCSHVNRNSAVSVTISDKPVNNIKEFDIIVKQWEFQPSVIEVNKGDIVKLNLENMGVAHSFTLPEFNIDERLEPGEKTSIEFIADKSGEFMFRCNILCGEGHSSMTGKIIVN